MLQESTYKVSYKCDNHKILSRDEERKLLEEYMSTRSLTARDKLITHNMKFTLACANAYKHKNSHVDIDDIKGYAVEGLIEAIDKYEPSQTCKFITYAVFWIKASINRNIEVNESIVRHPGNKFRDVTLWYKNGMPDDDSGYDDKECIDYSTMRTNMCGGISIDAPIDDDGDITIADTIQSHDVSYETIERNENIQKALNKLPHEQKYVLEQLFGFGGGKTRTTRDVAVDLDVSHETVRTLRNRGIKKLRNLIHTDE